MKKIILGLVILFFLPSCAGIRHRRAQNRLHNTKNAYQKCLKKGDSSECKHLKEIFEAELDAFKTVYDYLNKQQIIIQKK